MVSDRVPIAWDEADYINQAFFDRASLSRGPKPYIGALLKEDVARPPAYRILHVPFTLAVGLSTNSLRLFSFASLLIALGLVYLAVSEVAGTSAGLFSIIFVLPLTSVLAPGLWFSTEHAVYVAVAGSLWSLVRVLGRDTGQREYLLLGAFVGLGLLAKFTFVGMMVPLSSVLILGCIAGVIDSRQRVQLMKASIVALLIASPWYLFNIRTAVHFATYSSNYARLGVPYPSPIGRILAYVALMLEGGFGYSLAVLAALTFGLTVRDWHRLKWNQGHAVALLAWTATALFLIGIQLFTQQQNPRLTAPGLILIGAALAGAAGRSGLLKSRKFFVLSCCLVLFQVGLMLTHWPFDAFFSRIQRFVSQPASSLFTRERSWDWQRLRALCLDRLGPKRHLRIGHLGSGAYFNPPQIAHPWIVSESQSWPLRQPRVEVTWLWRYEDGPLDWQKLTKSLDVYDVLLTTPNYVGNPADRDDLDAVHNAEFIAELSADPRFTPPVVIRPFDDGPDIYVYFRKSVRER